MRTIDREVDRCLTLLRDKIRTQGFTQLEVQQALGWGRSYISQLLTKQKGLRVEQVLLILNVIGIDPAEFFGQLYDLSPRYGLSHYKQPDGALPEGFRELQALLRGLTELLKKKGLITDPSLSAAVEAANTGP